MTATTERGWGERGARRGAWGAPSDSGFKQQLERAVPLVWFVLAATAVLVPIGLVLKWVEPSWDLSGVQWLVDHRTSALDTFSEWGTWLAETVPVLLLTLLAMALARWRTGGWALTLMIGLAVGCEKLVYLFTSLIVGRDRPPVPPLGDTYATSSFPSGHVGAALALYGSIAVALAVWLGWSRWPRVVVSLVVAIIAGIVGFCRMYRGFHYPTDVAAGLVLGVASLVTAWSAMVRGRDLRVGTTDGPRPTQPSALQQTSSSMPSGSRKNSDHSLPSR